MMSATPEGLFVLAHAQDEASKEEFRNKLKPITDHIDTVLEETESMTSISAEQRLRNEMRYIKEKLEELGSGN